MIPFSVLGEDLLCSRPSSSATMPTLSPVPSMAIPIHKNAAPPDSEWGSSTESHSIFSEDGSDSSATEFDISDDSEAEELKQSVTFHRDQGRSKSRRSSWSNGLINREFQHWAQSVASPSSLCC